MSNLRPLYRMAGIAALAVTLVPAQLLIAGPLFKDYETVPQMLARGMRRILGIRVEFNGAAAEQKGPMIYIANHLSYYDPFILGCFVKGAGVSKSEIAGWPVAGTLARSLGTIFVTRNQNGKFVAEAQTATIKALNAGRNIMVFPEGTTSDGSKVLPFKKGVLTVMFNNLSDVKLEKDNVRVQAFAMRVTHVNGKAITAPSPQDKFAWYDPAPPMGQHFWKMLQTPSMRMELTALPVMNPKDYPDRQSFVTAAEDAMRKAVVRPAPS